MLHSMGTKRIRTHPRPHHHPRLADEEEAADADDASGVKRDGTIVYFYADVTKSNVLKFATCLREATQCALQHSHSLQTPAVHVHIHSDGGCAFSGLSAMDTILAANKRVSVVTIADGMVASAATLMLLAGARRVAMPHAFVLIHQLTSVFQGKYIDLIDEMANSNQLMQTFRTIYTDLTQMTPKRLDQLLKKELLMDAATCLQEGFVHEITH
jgi:ATP-dependent protease ClpP protease subunit